MTLRDPLSTYRRKRDFSATPEPEGPLGATRPSRGAKTLEFVVQKHWASRLHYDFRLEIDGTMKSWAVPKGPSMDPADKRLAVQVEDHPMAYNRFEGTIPEGHYGAGKVIVWDKGTWRPIGDAARGWREGKLKFELFGDKLHGHFSLVRMKKGEDEKQPPWLLIKEKHEPAPATTDEAVPRLAASRTAARAPPPRAAKKAPRAALPASLSPQLATLVEGPPPGDDWLYELKFDGYRLLARVERGKARLFTRNGHDWTDKLAGLARSVAALPLKTGWLDGEVIVPGDDGAPDFQALQNAFDGKRTEGVVYYLFDAPYLDGHDLRGLPLVERRERVRALVEGGDGAQVRFSEAFDAAPKDLVASACRIGFEGVIGKKRDGPYVSRRSPDWIKLKCSHRQEFVIGGYTDPQGSRTRIGSLLLGVHGEDGKLHYAGNVGTGFSEATLVSLHGKLVPLARKSSPFAAPVKRAGTVHWVEPKLLAEVSFAEWTRENHVRHSVFHGLRADKPAKAIGKEKAMKTPKSPPARAPANEVEANGAKKTTPRKSASPVASAGSLRVTHPERVIDASSGLRKIDLIEYYAKVGALMMDELHHRPVAVVRAPQGVGKPMFFQKHEEGRNLPGLASLDPALDPAHAALLEVEGPLGILEAAQMNVIEFHAWNARHDKLGKPDRVTFDLDPGDGVKWPDIQEAAHVMQVLLGELGLVPFLKTSGGKGLHVVVPIKRLWGWDEVKDFSQAVVQYLARMFPQRFVAKSGPKNRVGKIFVDYLRNGYGATTAAAWSARARPGMGISVPVAWDELDSLTGGAHWTVETLGERAETVGNAPWKSFSASAKALGEASRMIKGAG